jgi:hypothetical protein
VDRVRTTVIRRGGRLLAGVALLAGTVACSSAAQPGVEATAGQFAEALARHDGEAACALLTDDARRGTETFARSCAAQLAGLPDPGAVEQVEVWSDAAQVRLAGDTLFLLRFPDGWRVSAAGCTPVEEAPYECEVQG